MVEVDARSVALDRLDTIAIARYFNKKYNKEQRYPVPTLDSQFSDKPEPWIDWMESKGQTLNLPVNKKPEDVPGDLRIWLREEEGADYVFKVYLQKQLEYMMNGKRSVKIFKGRTRRSEDEESRRKIDDLRGMLAGTIKKGTDLYPGDKVVKKSNKTKPSPVMDLSVPEMETLVEIGSGGTWDFYEILAQRCILLLFQKSKVKVFESDKIIDEMMKSKKWAQNKYHGMSKEEIKAAWDEKRSEVRFPQISLLAREFYVGLSAFIDHRMKEGAFELETDNYSPGSPEGELDQKLSGCGVVDCKCRCKEKREATITRASRIFSLFVLSLIHSDLGWVRRLPGTWQDILLQYDGDEDKYEDKVKRKGMHPNMLHFTHRLLSEIGSCSNRDFLEKTQHPIFRVLDFHPKRWMNCCPEEHSTKISNIHGRDIAHEGGWLVSRPKSPLRASVSGPRYGGRHRTERVETSTGSLKALNILQKTQWEINLDLLDHIAVFHTEGQEDELEGFKDKKDKIDRIMIRKEFRMAYFPEGDAVSFRERELRLYHIKKIIDNLANVFWHAWSLDWRGRVVANAPLLSPQQSDLDRALIRFKEWKYIDESGWRWFRIFLFGFFEDLKDNRFSSNPEKHLTRNQRVEWIDDNEEMLKGIIGEWEDERNRELLELDQRPRAKIVTFQRLAALIEYGQLLRRFEDSGKDWSKVKSGHPVHFDASSNGLQHLSLLINNEELAKKVNAVRDDDTKKDIYKQVSDKGKENWENNESKLKEYLQKLGLSDEELSKIRELVFTRSMAKQPTMTVFYGAKRLDKCFMGRNGKGKFKFLCRKCEELDCEHMFDKKYRLSCWHESSPLYVGFGESKHGLGVLIAEGGLLFAKETSKEGRGTVSKQKIFSGELVKDYEKAIDEVTGNAVSELKEKLTGAIDSKGLSWDFPDGLKVKYCYHKIEDFDLTAEGMHLNKLIDIVSKGSYYHFLRALHESPKSSIKLDDEFIENAFSKFRAGNDKVKLLDNVSEWKRELLRYRHNKDKLIKILKEAGKTGYSKLKKPELAKRIVKEEISSTTHWDAICSHAERNSAPNNVLRAIHHHSHERLIGTKNDFEKRWMIHSNVSIQCVFPMFTKEKDLRKMKSSVAANFIHSMDGAHMRAIIREFDCKLKLKKQDSSIWSVHDSFGTHACNIDDLLETIETEMINLHSKGDLNSWIGSSGSTESNFRTRIKRKEIEVSEYFVS